MKCHQVCGSAGGDFSRSNHCIDGARSECRWTTVYCGTRRSTERSKHGLAVGRGAFERSLTGRAEGAWIEKAPNVYKWRYYDPAVSSNYRSSLNMRTMVVRTPPRRVPAGRALLGRVAAAARPFVDVPKAAAVLRWDSKRTAKQLARWHEQGLMRRMRRGVYTVVPASAVMHEHVVMDPWVLVPSIFRQAYVGGWSAAGHWDLTEQIFSTLLVCTTDALKRTSLQVSGITLRARHIPSALWFGTTVTWHESAQVLVSDVHKTVFDLFMDPALGGGIQHVTHCFQAYLRRDDVDIARLLSYASKAKSVPAFKRMGFVCEAINGPEALRDSCLRAVKLGLAKLDPAIESPRIS